MPSSDPARRFRHIVDAIDQIHAFVEGMSFDEYVEDERTLLAVERAFLVLCEAARALGAEAERLCPEISWPEVRGFGNVLRHEYQDVEDRDVWDTIHRDLAPLRAACLPHAAPAEEGLRHRRRRGGGASSGLKPGAE